MGNWQLMIVNCPFMFYGNKQKVIYAIGKANFFLCGKMGLPFLLSIAFPLLLTAMV